MCTLQRVGTITGDFMSLTPMRGSQAMNSFNTSMNRSPRHLPGMDNVDEPAQETEAHSGGHTWVRCRVVMVAAVFGRLLGH